MIAPTTRYASKLVQILRLFALFCVLVGLDWGTKTWVRAEVPMYSIKPLVPYLIDLTHIQNKGVSFSWLSNLPSQWGPSLLLGLAALILVIIGATWWYQRSKFNTWQHLGMTHITAGAVGNMIDRFYFGAVTDFLHFRFFSWSWFVNNIADIFISLGLIWFFIGVYLNERMNRIS